MLVDCYSLKMKVNQTEQQIQKSIVKYLRHELPRAIINHSRNEGNRGGKRGMIDGVRGKLMGVCAGYPDIVIHDQGETFFIEVKREKSYLTKTQREVRSNLIGQGYKYCIARSNQDVESFISTLRGED